MSAFQLVTIPDKASPFRDDGSDDPLARPGDFAYVLGSGGRASQKMRPAISFLWIKGC